jgi:hypothetical protein
MDERLVFGPAGCGASGREGFAWVGSCVGGFYLALGGIHAGYYVRGVQ